MYNKRHGVKINNSFFAAFLLRTFFLATVEDQQHLLLISGSSFQHAGEEGNFNFSLFFSYFKLNTILLSC